MGRQRWYTKDLQTTQHAASTSHHVMSDSVRLLHEKLEHRGVDFKRMDTRRTVELTPIQRRKRIDRAALGLDSKFANPTLEPFETAGQEQEEKTSAMDVIPKEVDAELVGVLQVCALAPGAWFCV